MFSGAKVQEIEYNPGDFILREGANCDSLIVVKTGQIEVYKNGSQGVKIPLGLVQSGEYLGEMAMISDRPHSANAVALTKTVCIKIPTATIEDQLKELPSWLVALTRGLVYKLNKTNDVLRRNGIVDSTLTTAVRAICDREEVAAKKSS